MDDSSLYTGVDGEGTFGNEKPNEATKELLDEQRRIMVELTPKLQDILTMIEAEKDITLDYISGYVDSTKDNDDLFRAELKAAGMYRKYLDSLKTKFALALREAENKK